MSFQFISKMLRVFISSLIPHPPSNPAADFVALTSEYIQTWSLPTTFTAIRPTSSWDTQLVFCVHHSFNSLLSPWQPWVVLLKVSQILPLLFSNPKAFYLTCFQTQIPAGPYQMGFLWLAPTFLSSLPLLLYLFFANSQSLLKSPFTCPPPPPGYTSSWQYPFTAFRSLLTCHFSSEAFCDHSVLNEFFFLCPVSTYLPFLKNFLFVYGCTGSSLLRLSVL